MTPLPNILRRGRKDTNNTVTVKYENSEGSKFCRDFTVNLDDGKVSWIAGPIRPAPVPAPLVSDPPPMRQVSTGVGEYRKIIDGVFTLPPTQLTDKECRAEWSESASSSSLLRFYLWNGTPSSMPCSVRLTSMQRWSELQQTFIDVNAAFPPYNFRVLDEMVAPEVRKAKGLVEAKGTGFSVLAIERDRTCFGSEVGRWKLDLELALGSRTRSQCLVFDWTPTGLALPKASDLDPAADMESDFAEAAIIAAPDPARVHLYIERKGDRWIGKLHNKERTKIGPCILRITDVESFDAELGAYREGCGFRLDVANLRAIPPGDFGNHFVFARLEGQHLEIGETTGTRLPWPQADTNPTQLWNLFLELSGDLPAYPAGVKWVFNLYTMWTPDEKNLTFKQYSSGLVHG